MVRYLLPKWITPSWASNIHITARRRDFYGFLGHGLSIATGMALAAKRDGKTYRVFVMLSDGECDEGSTWEPTLFAPQHKLDNLIAIVDYNKIGVLVLLRK